jgi:uncharacterized membrane protein/uncharacterized protein
MHGQEAQDTLASKFGPGAFSGRPTITQIRLERAVERSLMDDTIYLLAVLGAIAALAEWLGRRPAGRWLGGAIITLILGILFANLGVIPTITNAPPLYGYLISVGAPVAIFLLLLDVHLGALRRAGLPMLAAFGIGSAGTLLGVATAFWLTDAEAWLGRFAAPVGGMYAATYIGGSPNLTAVALHFGVTGEPELFAGANVADGIVGTLWLAALVMVVQLVHRLCRTRPSTVSSDTQGPEDLRPVTIISVSTLLALAFASFWTSRQVSEWTAQLGAQVPAILILTTLALLIAQVPAVQRLGGARMFGLYGSYLFIAVIGAACDFEALAGLGRTGGLLVLFVALVLLVHGLVQFGVGRLLKLSPETLAIASSANVGGTLTILPIARGLRRMDLLLPGILVGSLGNAIGTYAGFLMAWWLQSFPAPMSDAHAIPPAPTQSVANCDQAVYASDQLVCVDPELRALDRRLGELLARTSWSDKVTAVSLVEPPEAWFRRRSLCAFSERHAACLEAAYSERIAVITVIANASPEVAQGARVATCDNAPWGSADVFIGSPAHDSIVVVDTQARVLAVAFDSPAADWSPFVRSTTDDSLFRFTGIDGTVAECRTHPAS